MTISLLPADFCNHEIHCSKGDRNPMHYLYDGTYPGFLTSIYEIYHYGTSHLESIAPFVGESHLFGQEYLVETSYLHAEKVAAAFEKNCGKRAMRWLYRAFLSDDKGREMKLYIFMRDGFNLKKQIYAHEKEPWVSDIVGMCWEVGNETEKFRGILRFSELEDGFLYAAINPTHNILPVLATHFKGRLPTLWWAIYDVNRHKAAVYGNGKVSIVAVEHVEKNLKYKNEEKDYRKLWMDYYRHLSIEGRRNPEERRNFIPKKYWSYLTEMADAYNRQDVDLKGLGQKD